MLVLFGFKTTTTLYLLSAIAVLASYFIGGKEKLRSNRNRHYRRAIRYACVSNFAL